MLHHVRLSDHLKEDEMGGACSTQERERDEKFIQSSGWRT